jgi:ribosomal-protein-alanine N-acetyltransferase
MGDVLYRLGTVDDLRAVHDLNRQLFAEAWSKQSLLDVMAMGFCLYVAEVNRKLIGYILSQDILDETHIMQVAVTPKWQHQGIAKTLSQALFRSRPEGTRFMLEVRDSNIRAKQLYQSLGFQQVGLRKAYYVPLKGSDVREDAVLMCKQP